MSKWRVEEWSEWLSDDRIVERFEFHLMVDAVHWWWTGAVVRSGHGRFWVTGPTGERGAVVVAAHQFAFGLANGAARLAAAEAVLHECDHPSCQNPEHLVVGTHAENRAQWLARRNDMGSPLRDTRRRHERAVAIRDAARSGASVDQVVIAGLPRMDTAAPVLPGMEIVSGLLLGRHVKPASYDGGKADGKENTCQPPQTPEQGLEGAR